MTYVIENTRTIGDKYRCRSCRKWYQRTTEFAVSCCVLHLAGDCCHFMEIEVTKKGWAKRP